MRACAHLSLNHRIFFVAYVTSLMRQSPLTTKDGIHQKYMKCLRRMHGHLKDEKHACARLLFSVAVSTSSLSESIYVFGSLLIRQKKRFQCADAHLKRKKWTVKSFLFYWIHPTNHHHCRSDNFHVMITFFLVKNQFSMAFDSWNSIQWSWDFFFLFLSWRFPHSLTRSLCHTHIKTNY